MEPFVEWLVPCRSAIQTELLRLHKLMDGIMPAEGLEWELGGYLLGVTFSLWRAVFLADTSLEFARNLEGARKFLKKVLEDNAIAYRDDKNSWSFGYYLNNARFRILEMYRMLPAGEQSEALTATVQKIQARMTGPQNEPRIEWEEAYNATRLLIDLLSKRLNAGV